MNENMIESIIAILFFLALIGAVVHMLYIRSEVDNEDRVFTGSWWRIALLGLLLFSGVFMVGGFWDIVIQIVGTIIVLFFTYLSYLKPISKLLADGTPTKSTFQILGGMWTDLENTLNPQLKS